MVNKLEIKAYAQIVVDLMLQANEGHKAHLCAGWEAVDLIGLRCPEPLMLLRQGIKKSPSGAMLIVLADDQSTERDFARYCRFSGHQMLFNTLIPQETLLGFVIIKQK